MSRFPVASGIILRPPSESLKSAASNHSFSRRGRSPCQPCFICRAFIFAPTVFTSWLGCQACFAPGLCSWRIIERSDRVCVDRHGGRGEILVQKDIPEIRAWWFFGLTGKNLLCFPLYDSSPTGTFGFIGGLPSFRPSNCPDPFTALAGRFDGERGAPAGGSRLGSTPY